MQRGVRLKADRFKEVVREDPKGFAEEVGISLAAVYNYLNGRVPATDILYRISQGTNHPMEWFLEEVAEEETLSAAESA